MKSEQLETVIERLLTRLDTEPGALYKLTLEEIMMVRYRKPCRRVAPGNREAKKFGRGSVLLYEQEVLLVLEPEDNTTYFPHTNTRVVCPSKRRRLLSGSRYYTTGGVEVHVNERPDQVNLLRAYLKQARAKRKVEMRDNQGLFIVEALGKVRAMRCSEAWGLAAQIDVRRIKQDRQIAERDGLAIKGIIAVIKGVYDND